MGRHYSDDYKTELKQRVDLLSLASQYTTVKKFGGSYLAVCPFHDDRKPNLQIDPVNNTFYCHSCGAGSRNHSRIRSSDVISFYMHVANKGFHEAMEELSAMAGMTLPPITQEEIQAEQQRQMWIEQCKNDQLRFRENLANNEQAIQYLLNRGINATNIDRWELGFGDDINPQFKNTRGRITFPLFDYDGNIISFTGRVPWSARYLDQVNEKRSLEGKSEIVKYLEPQGFKKREYLYGIHAAKDSIRKWRSATLVEGYTDVISLHEKGLTNTVCSMGVALTEEQVKILKRAGAENVTIMRDGDKAGKEATERDAKILEENNIRPFVLPLDNGIDPDNFAQMHGVFDRSLHEYVSEKRMTFSQWHVMKEWKKNEETIFHHLSQAHFLNIDRRKAVIEALLEIQDPIERNALVEVVSELIFETPQAVQEMMDRAKESG